MRIDEEASLPGDRRYDPQHHLWARPDPGGGTVTVGMDALGVSALGDLVYLTLRPVGAFVERGAAFGTVEAAKMTGDLIAPISGAIAEVNAAALRDPSLLNRDPYGEGWLAVIMPAAWERESAMLIGDEALAAWAAAETERYREQGWIA